MTSPVQLSVGDVSETAVTYGYGTQAYGITPYGGQGQYLGYGQTAYGTYAYGLGESRDGSDLGHARYAYNAASNLNDEAGAAAADRAGVRS